MKETCNSRRRECRKDYMGEPKLKLVPDAASEAESATDVAQPDAVQTATGDYLAVPREQILARDMAVTDLFVRLSHSGKMIKVAHKGEKIDRERIERMGKKSVNELYVTAADFSGVIQDLIGYVRSTASKNPDADKAVAQYFQVAETVLVEVSKLPINDEAIGHAVAVSQDLASRMTEVNDLTKGLRMVLSMGEDYSRHAMGCVVMANWIARGLGWTAPRVLQPLMLGAFLHDVGLKELPLELQKKNRVDYTPEEVELYETHPTRGVMILRNFESIPADVLRIVQEHHEMPNGHGFPARLRGERMFPLAKIVSFANMLSHEMLDALLVKKNFSYESMLERTDSIYKALYGTEMHKAVRSIFKK